MYFVWTVAEPFLSKASACELPPRIEVYLPERYVSKPYLVSLRYCREL